jgi:soluble lytic murein transglycosylase-like protein
MLSTLAELFLAVSLLGATLQKVQAQIPYVPQNTVSTTIAYNARSFSVASQNIKPPETPYNAKESQEKPSQGQVRTRIAEKAREYGVKENLALAIAECESGFDIDAKNKDSSARGIFQFLGSTWKETLRRMEKDTSTSVYDWQEHIDAAIWLLDTDGTRHWLESKKCWSKKI